MAWAIDPEQVFQMTLLPLPAGSEAVTVEANGA
jgi:hypothetical protein